jgi:peptidyl-prolyl cis-trans isomerase D
MLALIRRFAKSPFAAVLMGLLVVSFAVFGISDVFRNASIKDAVIQAGGRTVGAAEYKRIFDLEKQQAEQQNGQPITNEEAVQAGLDRRGGEGMAASEAFAALVAKAGVRPSDAQVIEEIRKNPVFFDQISGRFDKTAYQSKLREAGLTEAKYEAGLRDQIAQSQFFSAIGTGLVPPRALAAILAGFKREGRSFSYFTIDPATAGPPPKPTDAELEAFIKSQAAQFTKPELRTLTIAYASAGKLAKTIVPDPADVQKRFDFEKDTLSTPEKRTIVQIPVKDAAMGAQVAARLRAGQDPAAVAKAFGVQPVVYTDTPKPAVSDRKIADAAFALKEGEVSGAVQGVLGMAVLKVTKLTPGHVATLEENRAKIEAEVTKDVATEKVYELVQKFDDARAAGATLAEAAKKAGVELVPINVPITAQGATLFGQDSHLPPKLVAQAFQLPASGESDMADYGNGEYLAARVEKLEPPTLAKLDEVRTAATQAYMIQDVQKRLKTRAEQLAAEIKKGKTLEAAAAEVGAGLGHGMDVHRDVQGEAFSRDLLLQVFNGKKGDILVAEAPKLGYVVARIENISTGGAPEMLNAIALERASLRNDMFSDMAAAAQEAARVAIKPTVDYKKAHAALGVEDAPEPAKAPAGKAPAGKAK